MIKIALSATAALYFAGIAQAQAHEEDGLYFAFRGYGAIHDQNNLHFSASREFGGAMGYRFSDVWRVEAEYSRRWAKITGLNGALTTRGDFDSHALGVHLFRDFRPEKKLRPFVGLGVGGGILDFDFKGPADNDPNLIVIGDDTNISTYGNVFAGSTYHINSKLRVGLGFEYFSFSDQAVESNIGDINGINRSYNFFVSMRWRPDFSR
tara:strand:- start:3231 stop:3854 length:624 start_codon:yes stop_codon:yes gene_type:complete